MSREKFIDVEKVIASKNPRMLRLMPGFLLRYLKCKLHEDEVNEFIEKNNDLMGADFCDAVMRRFELQLEVRGIENVPRTGGVIFACNHPLGGMDAMALVSCTRHLRSDSKFIVNDLLMNLENLKGMFVGVNKHGGNSKDSLRKVDALFGTDQAVFLFPSGLVSRRKRGKVRDFEWKKTFVTRARKHNRDIIPVYLDGELSNFFYRLANFRTFFGIKANIEMLYLVDELFKQHGKSLGIVFGKPIEVSTLDRSKSDKEWAAEIKEKVYSQKVELEGKTVL